MATLVSSKTALKARLFRGFSDISRLSILEALSTGPLPVGSIVEKTRLSRTNVCNHLRCLVDCELVVAHPQGRYTFYQVSDPRVSRFLSLADEVLEDVAHGVSQCSHYQANEVALHEEEQSDE